MKFKTAISLAKACIVVSIVLCLAGLFLQNQLEYVRLLTSVVALVF